VPKGLYEPAQVTVVRWPATTVLPYSQASPVDPALVETNIMVHLGFMLDLTALVPLYLATAVLRQGRPRGFVPLDLRSNSRLRPCS